jgi:hypothetical protein
MINRITIRLSSSIIACLVSLLFAYKGSDTFPLPRIIPIIMFTIKDSVATEIALNKRHCLLSMPCKNIFQAAYYPIQNKLIVVQFDAVVKMFRFENGSYNIYGLQSLTYKASVTHVYFTRIPELLYLLTTDIVKNKRLHKNRMTSVQDYSDEFEKINLSGNSTYEGIPIDTGDILGAYYYKFGNRGISLNIGGEKNIFLQYSTELADPYRSGPGDPLAQSVFMLKNNTIVSNTKTGWAIHDINGKLIKDFKDDGMSGWWDNPELKDGVVFVYRHTGPGGVLYKLDVQSGEIQIIRQ